MEEIMDLDYFKQEIEEKENKINELEKEIEELAKRAADYRMDHCEHRKGEICTYDPGFDACLDCYNCEQFEVKKIKKECEIKRRIKLLLFKSYGD